MSDKELCANCGKPIIWVVSSSVWAHPKCDSWETFCDWRDASRVAIPAEPVEGVSRG